MTVAAVCPKCGQSHGSMEAHGCRPDTATPAGVNPKDLQGAKKCDVSLLPAIATYHAAHAMVDGAMKYGPYNWREKKVLARVYIAAIKRHVERWEAGEELATDSGVHNLGGVIACAAILLDAQTTGNLGDNRPKSPAVLAAMDAVDASCKARCEPTPRPDACATCPDPSRSCFNQDCKPKPKKQKPRFPCQYCGAGEGEMHLAFCDAGH